MYYMVPTLVEAKVNMGTMSADILTHIGLSQQVECPSYIIFYTLSSDPDQGRQ